MRVAKNLENQLQERFELPWAFTPPDYKSGAINRYATAANKRRVVKTLLSQLSYILHAGKMVGLEPTTQVPKV